MKPLMKISVIIPCYNEEKTIQKIIKLVQNALCDSEFEIIIVDDASSDNTSQIVLDISLNEETIKVVSHKLNLGKGATLRSGINASSGDLVIIQDADLEYDPSEFEKLINPTREGKADVVYGSRFKSGEAGRVLYFWHRIGNLLLTCFSNMFTNLNLTDMETCYKVFRKEVLNQIRN